MIGHDLVSAHVRAKHAIDIARLGTFETHGVSEQAAISYLKTFEGKIFWQRLIEADPTASIDIISDRAIEQLTSGRELPGMEVLNEPLVKIVPAGEQVSPYSPYFAKESEFREAIAKGHNLNDRFGLPLKSEATVYDIYRINPKGPTEVFVSEVAPTSELDGRVRHVGGARQYLVPNRGVFTEAVHVGSLGNNLTLHNTHVAGKGLGVAIAPLAETTAVRSLRPGAGTAAKGLGIIGAVATGYDAADTAHEAARLRGQHNPAAAQARVERFAIQNASGWGAAAGFAATGAALGVESGPGLLITGAIGGVVGAVAGKEVADWLDERKINRQQDPQGNTWTFEVEHPDRGWQRSERRLDLAATAANRSDMPVYRTQTLSADAALSDRLTWQASNTSIELALGSPPAARTPYTLPANEYDTHSLRESPWTRNPDTAQWNRSVADGLIDRTMHYRTETASPQRAAQLDAQASAVVADNATKTPMAMAARYQAAYQRNGWEHYGPLPEAAQDALRHPGRIVASDGKTYERQASGHWLNEGLLRNHHAQGSLQQELDAIYQQQASYEPSSALNQTGMTSEYIPTLATVRVSAPRPPGMASQHPAASNTPAEQTPVQRYEAAVAATQGQRLDPFTQLYLASLHPDEQVERELTNKALDQYMNSREGQAFQQATEQHLQWSLALEQQAEQEARLQQQMNEATQQQEVQQRSRGRSM